MAKSSQLDINGSWKELLSGRNGLIIIALNGGIVLHAISILIVTTILPTVVKEIGGIQYYSWNTTFFVISSIIGSALASYILNKLGPKYSYLLALTIFFIGSIWCGFAFNMPFLLIGRVLQGFAGGLLLALSYALIRILFEEKLWARAIGVASGMWGIATLLGPALGGLFAQYNSNWRWAFWSTTPVIIILAFIISSQIESIKFNHKKSFSIPYLQIILLTGSVLILSLMGLTEDLLLNLIGVFCIIMSIISVVIIDSKTKNKLMPTGAYSFKHPIGLAFSVIVLMIMCMAIEVYIPYFLQTIQKISPLAAGYLTAVMAAGWTLGSLITVNKSGKQIQNTFYFSSILIFISLINLAILMPLIDLFNSIYLTILLILSLSGIGLGIGLSSPHLAVIVFNNADESEEVLASASVITIELFAMAVATAVAGIIVNKTGITVTDSLKGTQSAAFWLFAVFASIPIMCLLNVYKLKKLVS